MLIQTKEFKLETWGTMLSKPLIILLCGKAGVGKTTVATCLAGLFASGYEVNIGSFANSLKNCAQDYFGWDWEKDERGRKLLQELGRIGREYDKDLCVKNLLYTDLNEAFPSDIYIIDDWRFPNEKAFIEGLGKYQVYTIRIKSNKRGGLNNKELDKHESECSLEDEKVNMLLYNDYDTIEGLKEDVKKFIGIILKGKEV